MGVVSRGIGEAGRSAAAQALRRFSGTSLLGSLVFGIVVARRAGIGLGLLGLLHSLGSLHSLLLLGAVGVGTGTCTWAALTMASRSTAPRSSPRRPLAPFCSAVRCP